MKHITRHYLVYLLTVLIALQSVVAMADVHDFNQSGSEHLAFDHSHHVVDTQNYSHQSTQQIPDKHSQLAYDCSHCCHCHGHTSMVLTGTTLQVAALSLESAPTDFQANLISSFPPSLFRPPIA
ncbi:MAG: hypothetical protein ACRBCI_00985 [Cellvibrionaceae bacterium]